MALLATYLNEGTFASDWANNLQTGGTVTNSTTRAVYGIQSLRINRTSANWIWARPATNPFAGLRQCSGAFWLYAAALPSAANTVITEIWHATGYNLEITLGSTGQVKCQHQGGTPVSAASATVITAGTWYRISWTHDSSTGTAAGTVAVNADTPVTVSWTQTAEDVTQWYFGSDNYATASTYDLYFDQMKAYSTLAIPSPLHADPMDVADVVPQWGSIQAVSATRYTLQTSGSDLRPQGDETTAPTNYRRLSLTDGDNFSGERVEMGRNDWRYGIAGGSGTFMVYEPGQRYQTYFSMRLSADFPISNTNWQLVMQMKQAQPYTADGHSSPVIALQARQNQWQIITPAHPEASPLWTAPAIVSRWTRFHWDITYSNNSAVASIRLRIDDRAGATDFVPQYDSGTMTGEATLTDAVGAQSGFDWTFEDNQAIPSRLALGIYRNAIITGNTYIDVANVQVYQRGPFGAPNTTFNKALTTAAVGTPTLARSFSFQTTIHADPMDVADVVPEWGAIQAASSARYTLVTTGTDTRPRGDGTAAPANYRHLALVDGDNFFGERNEVGANERRNGITGGTGTFMLYQPGQTYQTYFSMRLASDFPVTNANWQVIMQMKQCQPYTNDGHSSPIIALQARQSQWQLITDIHTESDPYWTAPATLNRWTRFRLDITYSKDVALGRIRVQIDDRSGSPTDFVPQYDSGDLYGATLTAAVGAQSGSGWSLTDGQEIQSHLRLGPYRNSVISGNTSIDLANVQVYQGDSSVGGSIFNQALTAAAVGTPTLVRGSAYYKALTAAAAGAASMGRGFSYPKTLTAAATGAPSMTRSTSIYVPSLIADHFATTSLIRLTGKSVLTHDNGGQAKNDFNNPKKR